MNQYETWTTPIQSSNQREVVAGGLVNKTEREKERIQAKADKQIIEKKLPINDM